MIAVQEELDWEVHSPRTDWCPTTCRVPARVHRRSNLGERAFEIVLGRSSRGEAETTWFARHGSTAITELPVDGLTSTAAIVERRIALIESDRDVGLIERPENKRRWNQPRGQSVNARRCGPICSTGSRRCPIGGWASS